jgi:hypothetical protein
MHIRDHDMHPKLVALGVDMVFSRTLDLHINIPIIIDNILKNGAKIAILSSDISNRMLEKRSSGIDFSIHNHVLSLLGGPILSLRGRDMM